MKHAFIPKAQFWRAGAAVLTLVLILAAGCKNRPAARTDQQLTTDIQSKIEGEAALAGQNIRVTVAKGVATLNGTVTDEASRALAANDSGTITGVKTVVNNLTIQPGSEAAAPAAEPTPSPAQAAPAQRPAPEDRAKKRPRHERKEEAQCMPAPQPVQEAAAQAAPAPQSTPQPPPPPPAPPKPVVKEVTLPAGTVIPIRVTETIDSKTAQANDVFHGSLAGDLGTRGVIAIRHGSPVMGRIADAREAAHFKGSALLSLELTELTAQGKKVPVVTDTFSKEGQARGKNTAAKAGGGAALGSIIGALAGGGKGAVIGGLAGGAAGGGINAVTHGEQAVIPTETLINFRLQSPITLTVTIQPPGGEENNDVKDPELQRR